MKDWIKTHWKQIATVIASLILGYLLHAGKITTDQATAIGAGLMLFGIHLPAISYGSKPSGGASAGTSGSATKTDELVPPAQRSSLLDRMIGRNLAFITTVWAVTLGLLVYAGCAASATVSSIKTVAPSQVVCLIDRQAAIVECVRANPDKPSIDACLATVEGRHCEADALAAVKEVPEASTDVAQPVTVSSDAGVEQ